VQVAAEQAGVVVRWRFLDSGPRPHDHLLVAVGVVAQTPCDVIANLNLHTGLAEVDIAAVMQFKAHHVHTRTARRCIMPATASASNP
jgi:hypothetical protein